MGKFVVEAKDLEKRYWLGEREVPALKRVNFAIEPGEFLAFVGSSGSGKTTLLNLIGGLDHASSGFLAIDNQDISKLSDDALSEFRAGHLGFVFQTFNLLSVLSASENVEYPLLHTSLSATERKARVSELLKRVGLGEHADHRPAQLSGGQRQRVAIARALVHKPRIVIADEPTANLDRKTAIELLDLMHALNRETGVTFIFSTHDPLIIKCASRVLELMDGEIVT